MASKGLNTIMSFNNVMLSKNRAQIKSQIMIILGNKMINIANINKYIEEELKGINGIISQQKINDILISTGLLPYSIIRNTDIIYLKNLYFLLKHNIPLGQDFSIFSNQDRITGRRNEVGLGRAYNILSNEKFNKRGGLGEILQYLNIEKKGKYYAKIYKFLKKDSYKQYFDTFKLNIGTGYNDFFSMMKELLDTTLYTQRCIILKKYLDTYNATFFSFSNTENIPYTSFRKSYKKHNNSTTKTDKTQVFTYVFYQLYKDMTEKNIFKNSIAKFKNNTKTLTKEQLEQKIKNINTANQKGSKQLYYKEKIRLLEDRIIYINKEINEIGKIRNKREILAMNTSRIISPDVRNAVRKMQKELFNEKIESVNQKVRVNPFTFTRNKTLRKYIRKQKPKLIKERKQKYETNFPSMIKKNNATKNNIKKNNSSGTYKKRSSGYNTLLAKQISKNENLLKNLNKGTRKAIENILLDDEHSMSNAEANETLVNNNFSGKTSNNSNSNSNSNKSSKKSSKKSSNNSNSNNSNSNNSSINNQRNEFNKSTSIANVLSKNGKNGTMVNNRM
jgi:hypothetical protein